MYWKRKGELEYLIRTSPVNTQKSLGRRAPETESIYTKFMERKTLAEGRLKHITEALVRHQRLNRALFVGRAPQMLVDVLSQLERAGVAERFTVVGTHALYAYEAAAGVRIESAGALETQDIDLLWDTRKRLVLSSRMKDMGVSMIGLLQKVDPSFKVRRDQLYTAVNSKGFEVDIIRREVSEGDPHPAQITDDEDDFWVAQAEKVGVLLNAPRFSSVIVSPPGYMARMTTISPIVFADFKRWLSENPKRDTLKRKRDALQADIVDRIVDEYLPHLKERADAPKGPRP